MSDEFTYINWLRARTPPDLRVLIGPGDDCAALVPPARPLLVTTDMLMDGVDFVVAEVGPRRAGRKAMAANLSDIAAMAGVPVAAVVSVALPRPASGGRQPPDDFGRAGGVSPLLGGEKDKQGAAAPRPPGEFAEQLYLGLRDAADAFGVAIVGGDTNSWDGRLVISV